MEKLIEIIKKILSVEFWRYIIGGGMTTFLNFFIYVLLLYCGVVYHLANLIAIIIAKVASYFINKLFVYRSHNKNLMQTATESFRFFMSRAFTGVVDYVLVFLLVESLHLNKIGVKIFVMIIVIVLNYVLGKFYVFNNKKSKTKSEENHLN